ncbi:hypothetical protein PT340_000850 [Acinetobacter baumannii]|nr:hypothetical protein [Acinetobacter baumannii]ELB0965927.1 hypothetical protein [Acinetobacter baumannii]ELB1056205.1 hypothetical protein [Acinetobacter baumannii]ELQ8922241.1 hypothetical protein [Acinetobacter baumannii]
MKEVGAISKKTKWVMSGACIAAQDVAPTKTMRKKSKMKNDGWFWLFLIVVAICITTLKLNGIDVKGF